MIEEEGFQFGEFLDSLATQIKDLPRKFSTGISDYQRDFKKVYRDSGIMMYIDDYIHRSFIIMSVSAVAFYIVSLGLMTLLLSKIPWWSFDKIMLASFATALIGTTLTGFAFYYYPYYKRGEAKGRLEDGLIYFLSYMAVLSASGMPIERILERITEVEDNPPLIHLSKKFIMNVKLFGMNVRTALKDIADISPSHTLAKQIEAIRTSISTSGDLKSLLTYEVDRQMQVKREKLKAKVNSLVYVGEIYVSMMVITPTLFILVISILSVLGGGINSGAIVQLDLLIFVGLPILGGIFLVLLDQTMGREE